MTYTQHTCDGGKTACQENKRANRKLFHKSYSSKLQTPSFLPGCKFGKTQTRLDSERSEQIEQLKSEHVQHLEEVKDTAKKAAVEDLEDDLFDGLSDITMLATFSAMQEVWPKEETRL